MKKLDKKINVKPQDFIKALTIKQRYNYLKDMEDNLTFEETSLNEWINRKSVLKEELYKDIMSELKYDVKTFSNAIKEDTYQFNSGYKEIVKLEDWFIELTEIFELANDGIENYDPKIGYGYLIRPFIEYAALKLGPILEKHDFISEAARIDIYTKLSDMLLNNVLKSFVLELNISKLKGELKGETPEERFKDFIILKSEIENLYNFYKEYAVLTKILVRDTKLFIMNTKELLYRIDQDKEDLKSIFELETIMVKGFSFGEGDTHQNGKSVVIITLNSNNKLVYKPKNLKVITAYNSVIERLNIEKNLLDLLPIKALIRDEYCFEFFIEQKSCKDEKQVTAYYERFGQLLAVMHMLNGNDLHMENLIAHGEYPMIVDLETLFQTPVTRDFSHDADLTANYQLVDFVSGTLLLPQKILHNEEGDVIEMSALSGGEQTLTKKGFKPTNLFTDNMRYELDNLKIAASNNQTFLNDQIVDYQKYIIDILRGFENTMFVFLKHKDEFLGNDGVIQRFSNLEIRIILRNTFVYAQLLQNTLHPDYMRDYYYYEQIIENLWAYNFKEKSLIKSEYLDILSGDIPIFFTKTTSKDIYDSRGKQYTNLLNETGYDRVRVKFENLSQEYIDKQLSVIKIKTGHFEEKSLNSYSLQEKILPSKSELNKIFLSEAMKIGDDLINSAIIDDASKTMTWITANQDEINKWDIGTLSGDLYSGLGGISLFYHYLYKETNENNYKKYRDYTFNMALKKARYSKYNSGFLGFASLIYPATTFLKDGPNRKFKQALQEATTLIEKALETPNEHIDWLHGSSSVIEMLIHAFEVNGDSEYINIALQYANDILKNSKFKELTLGGLSHGFSGLATTFIKLGKLAEQDSLIQQGLKLVEEENQLFDSKLKGWLDNRSKNDEVNHFWCNGTVGIGCSRLNIADYLENNTLINNDIENTIKLLAEVTGLSQDCLCHGNAALVDYFIELFKYNGNEEFYHQALEIGLSILENYREHKNYNIKSFDGFQSISLFNGISGIGYIFLRLINPQGINSVLRLK